MSLVSTKRFTVTLSGICARPLLKLQPKRLDLATVLARDGSFVAISSISTLADPSGDLRSWCVTFRPTSAALTTAYSVRASTLSLNLSGTSPSRTVLYVHVRWSRNSLASSLVSIIEDLSSSDFTCLYEDSTSSSSPRSLALSFSATFSAACAFSSLLVRSEMCSVSSSRRAVSSATFSRAADSSRRSSSAGSDSGSRRRPSAMRRDHAVDQDSIVRNCGPDTAYAAE